MKTFNYAPASPIKDNITMLAVSVGMVVVPLVYPFGIRIGSTRILGPTSTAIVFIIGGLVLLVITLNKVRLARALAANGGKIVVDADSVTYPIIKKGEKTDKIFSQPTYFATAYQSAQTPYIPKQHHIFSPMTDFFQKKFSSILHQCQNRMIYHYYIRF